jgi:hypothetical protein
MMPGVYWRFRYGFLIACAVLMMCTVELIHIALLYQV